MKITKQNNWNECGVCVINSFIDHFYHTSNKDHVLDKANLSSDGLSVFEFEVLANEFDMFAESYQLSMSELINLKVNNYFVVLIKRNNGLHYVIVKKHKKYLQVFDSSVGVYNTSYKEFAKVFSEIIIFISKQKKTIKLLNSKFDVLKNIDLKFLLISLLIQIGIIALTTTTANFLNEIINNSINSQVFKNALLISLIFLLIHLMNNLLKYILILYTAKYFKVNFQFLCHELLKKLKIKKMSFYNKINVNEFYIIDNAIQSIVNFLTIELSSFCSNIILSCVVMIIISVISTWFIIVCLIIFFITLICCFFKYQYQNQIFSIGINNQNINSHISEGWIKYFNNHTNCQIKSSLINDLSNNYFQYNRIYINQVKFGSFVSFIETLIQNVMYIVSVLLVTYLILNNTEINVGQLIFVITLIGMLTNAFEQSCNFFVKKVEYKKMFSIYQSFISLSNIDNYGNTKINKVTSIELFNENKQIKLVNGNTYYDKSMIDILTLNVNKPKLIVNDIKYDLNFESYYDLIFYINEYTELNKKMILKNINISKDHLSFFKINLSTSSKLNFYDQIKLNLMCTLEQNNKLIILDNVLKYLTQNDLDYFKTYLLPIMCKTNFVILFA